MRKYTCKGYYSISRDCGLLLYILAYAIARLNGHVRVAAIGTCASVSALCLAKALRYSGASGLVSVLDYDTECVSTLREELGGSELERYVEICENASSMGELRDIDLLLLADTALVDPSSISSALAERSIAVVGGVLAGIHKNPLVLKAVVEHGFTRALIPVDSGLLLLAKKVYDDSFLRKTIDVYRESFIQGPNPVH